MKATSPIELTCAMEWESVAAAEGLSTLPRFRMVAYTGSPMRVSGWRNPIVVDLAGLSIPSQARPIRLGHDAALGVGHTDSIRVEGGRLVATGIISRDTASAREVVASSRNGFPWQASIGASVEQAEFIKENQTLKVNGQEFVGPLNVVRKATLGEISFVDLGADGQTSAYVAAIQNLEEPTVKENEAAPENTTTADASKGTTGAATAVAVTTPPAAQVVVPDISAQIRAQAAAEMERIASIHKFFDGKHADLEAMAVRNNWDLNRCELEVLRANRPQAPAIVVTHPPEISGAVLEAACAMGGKLNDVEKHYDANTLESADKRFRGKFGLQDLLLEAAWANGYTGRNFRDSRAVLRHAFASNLSASVSSIEIGGILSNIANKFLLEGFYSVEQTWRNICTIRPVSDFKTVTSYRLIGKDQYEKVAPGGELKQGTLGQESFSNKADTYGLMLSIDRRDIINDDLGAITLVPRKLGRGSGTKLNDVFWTAFLNNGAFFTAANKNFVAGVDTVLSIDGLTKSEVAFMEQVDGDGKPIGVMPAILLVAPALSAMASQLNKALEIRDTTANQKYPIANPHQGKYRAEVSRYISNAAYPGNSSKAWYLLSEPSDLAVIEVAFLNGQESPTIETAEADFNVLGVQMRGYHDFGVALQDPRGGVKSKGEV